MSIKSFKVPLALPQVGDYVIAKKLLLETINESQERGLTFEELVEKYNKKKEELLKKENLFVSIEEPIGSVVGSFLVLDYVKDEEDKKNGVLKFKITDGGKTMLSVYKERTNR